MAPMLTRKFPSSVRFHRASLLTAIGVLMIVLCDSNAQVSTTEPESKGVVTLEFIAHACFVIHSPGGVRVLIDMYGRGTGYDFPLLREPDILLITHDHYDHNNVPGIWTAPVLREPGRHVVGDVSVEGLLDTHVPGYRIDDNIIWVVEIDGLRIVHLGDNQVPRRENIERLGRVDILMAAIDATYHILNEDQIEELRTKLRPRVLVPIHYFHPSLTKEDTFWLGPIDPWLEGKPDVVRLKENIREFSRATLPQKEQIVVFPPSPKVTRP